MPAREPLENLPQLLSPGPLTRIAAWMRRGSLDRALSHGVSPTSSQLLAARARQLSRASTREQIAGGLERIAQSVDGPRSAVRVEPSRRAIAANRDELLALASTLRRDELPYANGVAALELVVTDGTGPAYTDHDGELLARELQSARLRLGGLSEGATMPIRGRAAAPWQCGSAWHASSPARTVPEPLTTGGSARRTPRRG